MQPISASLEGSIPSAPGSVLVVGATGRIGRALVEALQREGAAVRAFSRRPGDAGLPAGVEVVAGDLTKPETLTPALDGAEATFLLWTAPRDALRAAIERIASSTKRVVALTSPHRTPHPFFQQPNPMRDLHEELEERLARSGVPHTIIRPGMFASNCVAWWGAAIRAGDRVRWPYAAVETAPIAERDVAAVAARALLDAGHEGRDYVLTGPAGITHRQQVAVIGAAIGRPLELEELMPEEFRRDMAGRWPPAAVEMLLAAWGAAEGHDAHVTTTVADVTGTPARSFATWARENASAFGGAVRD